MTLQLLPKVMHYITITIKTIVFHYNYRVFDDVMDYITITSQSNALHYNFFKGFRKIMKFHDIQTIQF